MLFYMSRRYDEAIEQLSQVDATDPGTTDVTRWLMSCFTMKGDQSDAFDQLVKLEGAAGASSEDIGSVKSAFGAGGWQAALRAALEVSTGIANKKSLLIAGLLAQIGEKDKAFEVLDDIRKGRRIMRINVANEPLLDPLRDDPRFEAILSQMNLK